MCGIAGILKVWTPAERELALCTPHGQSIPEPWLDILDDSIKHRGPDGHGRFRDRAIREDGCVVDVAFVHRRLSIIDHAGGHQPMVLRIPKGAPSASSGGSRPIPGRLLSPEELEAHNRRTLAEAHSASHEISAANTPELALGALSHDHIAVVFNGCIYNHRELRAELQRAGHVFSTDHSDTEVLVHGWREWGREMFSRLEGMYALGVWDARAPALFVARDYFGEKPAYWVDRVLPESGSTRAFASTNAALERLITKAAQPRERGSRETIPQIGSSELDALLRQGFGDLWQRDATRPRAVPKFGCANLVPDDGSPKAFFGRFTPDPKAREWAWADR